MCYIRQKYLRKKYSPNTEDQIGGHQQCHSNEMFLRYLAHDHKQRDRGQGAAQFSCDYVEADNVFYTLYLFVLA